MSSITIIDMPVNSKLGGLHKNSVIKLTWIRFCKKQLILVNFPCIMPR